MLSDNIKILSIIVLLPEIRFLYTINTSSVSVTVTCSLIRVPILRRVYINIISQLSLKLFIISEYKPGYLVGPNGITRNIYFLFVCCKEGSFFSVDMVNWNVMTSLFCIQVDDPNFIWPGANGAYRIITIWNRELIFFDNTINFYIRNIYYLYETINVWNMSLMRFYGQDNAATPGFSTFFYP